MALSHEDSTQSRILIADPDLDIRESLQVYFETYGHKVKTVETAETVLRVARPWQPHTILISTEFAEVDAHQICRDLLDDSMTGHIPVVMMLHIDDRKAKLAALEAGVGDIIIKPFDLEELRLRVEAAIRFSTQRSWKPT